MPIKLSEITRFAETLFKILWLSLFSTSFYKNVYKKFTGYGFKYILTVSFFSSIIYAIFLLYNLNNVMDYFFDRNKQYKETANFEYILNQLPEIKYDGQNITANITNPLYIVDLKGKMITAIDPNNQLPYNDKIKLPLIFAKDKIIFSIQESSDQKYISWPIEYTKLIKNNEIVINSTTIKGIALNLFQIAPRLFIYIIVPFLVIFRLISLLLEKSFIIVLLYIITNFFGPVTSLKTATRLVIFTAGVPTLIIPIISILTPQLINISWVIQIWVNALLVISLVKIRQEESGAP